MSTADEIHEIQKQIWELQAKQKVLREREHQEKIEEIRRLDWLRGQKVFFMRNPHACAGIPTYTLTIAGKNDLIEGVVGFGGSVCLYGDNPLYEYNITLRSGDVWGSRVYTIETSSMDILLKFINEVDLKFVMDQKDVTLNRTIMARLVSAIQ